jgi:hypothetical protein
MVENRVGRTRATFFVNENVAFLAPPQKHEFKSCKVVPKPSVDDLKLKTGAFEAVE